MRVSLCTTCLVGELDGSTGIAAARLLRHLGIEVVVPKGQTCCGQPAFNAGHVDEARRIARYTLETLESGDMVVLPSASCTAMIRRHYAELFSSVHSTGSADRSRADARGRTGPAGGPDGTRTDRAAEGVDSEVAGRSPAARARALASRTYELCEFIVRVLKRQELGDGLRGRRVAWHHGCHGLREMSLSREPIELLRNAGATIVDWQAGEECCGFGGLFTVKLPEVSAAMADRKLDTLLRAGADVLTSADAACLLHLEGRARKRGIQLKVRHVAHLLLEATGAAA